MRSTSMCGLVRFGIVAILTLCLADAEVIAAEPENTFVLVSKNVDDPNFVEAWRGCQSAASRNNDRCVHVGGDNVGYFRAQNRAIEDLANLDLSGVAISVTNSEFIGDRALPALVKTGVPVITFDSDLAPAYHHLRQAFIGVKNRDIGRLLAKELRRMRPAGGTVCLMSAGPFDPNLNERIDGFRQEMRGARSTYNQKPLDGEGGWWELARCPWYNKDNVALGLTQFRESMINSDLDAFVVVGSLLLHEPDMYVQTYEELPDQVKQNRPVILMATGTPTPVYLSILDRNMVDRLVVIDFFGLGEAVYQYFSDLNNEEKPDATRLLQPHIIKKGGEGLFPNTQ